MKQITIDFKNDFDCSKKEKSKGCRSGYVRLVRFMDVRSILGHKCMRAICWKLLWM